jgi:hypothetical protein
MRKAFRHSGVLMMSAIVALGLLGAGFALWFQVLTFNGTVNTGELEVEGSIHPVGGQNAQPIVCIMDVAPDTDGDCNDYGDFVAPTPGKDVTTCNLTLNAPKDTWTLIINNAFPFSGCMYTLDVTNTGTIPVHLNVSEANDSQNFAPQIGHAQSNDECELTVDGVAYPVDPLGVGGTPAYDIRFSVDGNGDLQFQLHPGESIACTYKVWLLQSADENATYTFVGYQVARQYNEDMGAVTLPPPPYSNP